MRIDEIEDNIMNIDKRIDMLQKERKSLFFEHKNLMQMEESEDE